LNVLKLIIIINVTSARWVDTWLRQPITDAVWQFWNEVRPRVKCSVT